MVKYEWDESNGVSVPTNKLMVIDAEEYYVGMPLKKVDASTVAPTDGDPEYICLAQRNAGDEIKPLQIPVQEVFPDAVYTKILEDGTEEKVKFGGGGKITPEQLPEGYPYVETEWKEVSVTSVMESDGPTILEGFPVFSVGDTVNLKVDGVEYSLVAFEEVGAYFIGDRNAPFMQGVGEYGWMIGCMDGVVLMLSYEPHTVSWKVTKYHPIDHKFLPDGYPYSVKTDTVFFDEDITVTSSYYEDSQFYYSFSTYLPEIKSGTAYDVTFLGETIDGCVAKDGYINFTTSGGAAIHICESTMYSDPGDGLVRPFTTHLKIVERAEEVHIIADKYLPNTSKAMIVVVATGEFSESEEAFTTATIEGLWYYDTGEAITIDNCDRLVSFLNSGGSVLLFNDRGERVGSIWQAHEGYYFNEGQHCYVFGVVAQSGLKQSGLFAYGIGR